MWNQSGHHEGCGSHGVAKVVKLLPTSCGQNVLQHRGKVIPQKYFYGTSIHHHGGILIISILQTLYSSVPTYPPILVSAPFFFFCRPKTISFSRTKNVVVQCPHRPRRIASNQSQDPDYALSTFIHFHPLSSTLLGHLVPWELPVVKVNIRIKLGVFTTLVVATVIAKPNVVALETLKMKFIIHSNLSLDQKLIKTNITIPCTVVISWYCFEPTPSANMNAREPRCGPGRSLHRIREV